MGNLLTCCFGRSRSSRDYVDTRVPLPGIPKAYEGAPHFFHEWVPSSADGMRIYNAVFESTEFHEAAVVIYAHAGTFHSHAGGQAKLIEPLQAHGYTVWAYDKRGHGRTGKATHYGMGDVGDFEDRMEDLSTVVSAARARFPKSSVFLMGHSLGGGEILSWMSTQKNAEAHNIKGIILLAPFCQKEPVSPCVYNLLDMIGVKFTVTMEPGAFSKNMDDAGYFLDDESIKALFNRFDVNGTGFLYLEQFRQLAIKGMKLDISEDSMQAWFDKFDDNHDGRISLSEFMSHLRAQASFDEFCMTQIPAGFNASVGLCSYERDPESITVPTLLVHGVSDKINPYSEATAVVDSLKSPDKTVVPLPDGRHGVWMDDDGATVTKELLTWLDKHTL